MTNRRHNGSQVCERSLIGPINANFVKLVTANSSSSLLPLRRSSKSIFLLYSSRIESVTQGLSMGYWLIKFFSVLMVLFPLVTFLAILIFLIFADIPAPFRGADCGILRCMHAGIMDGIASGGGGKGRAPRRINGGGGACPPNGGGNGGPFRHIGGIGGSMSGWNSCGGGIGGPIGPIIPRGPCPTIGGIMRPLRLPPNPAAPDPMPFSVKSVLFPFVLDTLLLLIIGTGGVGKLKSKYPGLSEF
uniref:Uncharacterized protein n=1 Tax=Glossina palpalis gambiensis TaxID=67801 RepID=A0A1B0BFV1_9MUSC